MLNKEYILFNGKAKVIVICISLYHFYFITMSIIKVGENVSESY